MSAHRDEPGLFEVTPKAAFVGEHLPTGDWPEPFVPRPGDLVAVCHHAPRLIHIRLWADRAISVDGQPFEHLNLCRACRSTYDDNPARIHLTPYRWMEADAADVRATVAAVRAQQGAPRT